MNDFDKIVNELRGEASIGKTRYNKLLRALNMYVSSEKIDAVYPKNWKNEEEDLHLLVFENDRLSIFKNNIEDLKIEVYKYSEINKLELYTSKHENEVKFSVEFKNSEALILSNIEDTNNHNQQEFVPIIKEIFKYLKTK